MNLLLFGFSRRLNLTHFSVPRLSELDHYRTNGGEPPQCGVTLCFGEELSNTEDPSGKLIIVQVSVLHIYWSIFKIPVSLFPL